MQKRLSVAVATLLLSACTSTAVNRSAAGVSLVEDAGWRALVTPQDERRMTTLTEDWRRLLASVPHRYQKAVATEGDLLLPDAARDHPTPPPGSYRCRLVKLAGSSTTQARKREAPIKSFPDFFCYIRGEKDNELSFTKQTGTELPRGWLHRDSDRRLILIGARQREAGDNSLAYGMEPDRDVVGVVERIGPFRWRVALPWRGAAAGLDIYELTPVPQAQQAEEPRTPPSSTEAPLDASGATGQAAGKAAPNP